VADVYERARPGYPAAAVDGILELARLGPASTVLDVGAGTGKLTRLLVGRVGRTIAVEPTRAMRERLREEAPDAEAIDAAADQTGLPDASVDAITVAQAFHWFSTDAALREFHRVLREEGALVIVWNSRDRSQPLQQQLQDVIVRHRRGAPTHRSGAWKAVLDGSPLFSPESVRHYPNEQRLDADLLVDRVASTSVIAQLPDAERIAVLDDVRRLATGQPQVMTLRYTTELHVYRRA
jgi:ubiquinone/menaquinone biosynthesis C-methylase UbiE